MNLQIREFEQDIIGYINQSPLPIEVKRLIIKDIFYQVSKTADEAVILENQRKEQENQNEQDIENIENEEVTE